MINWIHNIILIEFIWLKSYFEFALNLQKDIIRWQALVASNRDDYLMSPVHCLQFWNKKRSNSLEWRLLMDQSCPRHEVQRIYQQFLREVCLIIQLFNITGVYVCSFPPFLFIYLFYEKLKLCSMVFDDYHRSSPIRDCNFDTRITPL